VTTGGSLSPRGDWRAPSDGNARLWLEELRRNVPHGDAAVSAAEAERPERAQGKPIVR
jgi:hypothetical protein